MYVANTAIPKLQNFSGRYHFRYGFLLLLLNTFTIDTGKYYPRCYKKNDAKAFKNLVVSFYGLCWQII